MNYQEFINNILHIRGRFMGNDEYHERHHIVPKCKGGTDAKENLIDLFAREHFIVHKLLAEENVGDDQLACAYAIMAFAKDKNQQRYELSPEEYEDARQLCAQKFTGENNPSARQVIRLNDEKIYSTVRDCCNDNNIDSTTMWIRLKQYRDFMYYDEWLNMSDIERENVRSVDWDGIQHRNRSEAANKAGNGGSIKCSQSTREKISAANKGKHGVNIYCPELNEMFLTIKDAEDKYGVNRTSIGYCLCGKQKHAGKHPVTGVKLSWVKLENKNS